MNIYEAMDLSYQMGYNKGQQDTIESLGGIMISAMEAKQKVINNEKTSKYWTSIIAKIYESINLTLLHCVWYTPPMHNCTTEEIEIIKELANKLTTLGYVCTMSIFEPNENFYNTRVKLHIGWE